MPISEMGADNLGIDLYFVSFWLHTIENYLLKFRLMKATP